MYRMTAVSEYKTRKHATYLFYCYSIVIQYIISAGAIYLRDTYLLYCCCTVVLSVCTLRTPLGVRRIRTQKHFSKFYRNEQSVTSSSQHVSQCPHTRLKESHSETIVPSICVCGIPYTYYTGDQPSRLSCIIFREIADLGSHTLYR